MPINNNDRYSEYSLTSLSFLKDREFISTSHICDLILKKEVGIISRAFSKLTLFALIKPGFQVNGEG